MSGLVLTAGVATGVAAGVRALGRRPHRPHRLPNTDRIRHVMRSPHH
ncbi:hypothetical protein [Streptomyces sp. NPDC001604]